MKTVKRKPKYLILGGIFLLALFLRFYKITSVPISLNWDEAAFAYNAYSILETGKDEYGNKMPLEFKSVGDYKCPLFVYLLVPVVKILGLNELAVRFLPSLFGALTVIIFCLLVEELFEDWRLALLSALLLAISPWHLQFTRAQGDVAISSFFVIFGIWQFLRWVKGDNPISIYLSVFSFVMTFYAYFSERLFTPVLFLGLTLIFYQKVISRKKQFLIALFFGLLLIFPLFKTMVSSGQKSKILMTTIFGYHRPEEYLQKTKSEDYFPIVFEVFHHPVVEYGLMIVDRYFNQFSPYFLFIRGVNDDRQRIEGMGMLYWSDFILLLLAIFTIVSRLEWFKKKKEFKFVLVWLAISPLPAIITRDPVHARRAFNMIYPLCLLLAIGAKKFIDWVKAGKLSFKKIIAICGFCSFFIWSLSLYFLSYYIITPPRTAPGPGGWYYGYKQLVEYISPLKNDYRKIIVDTSYQGPYLFFLFYEKYPPVLYQPQAVLVKKDEFSLGEGRGYDQYEFRDIYWPADRGLKKTLFAGPPERLPLTDIDPKQAKLLKTIYFPDGKEAFRIVETY